MTAMRIIDLQRRLREIGRIRIGEKVPTRNGKTRPAKIDVFRFTSRDRQVIDAAAARWGGTVEPWPEGPGGNQWQVRSTVNQIPVIVPPGDMSFSQSYEQWTAGGCQVRCDGRWDHVGDTPCHCDPEARDCKIHTRLSVIVPDLPGIGVWRLETHGYYAAVELGGVVDLCAAQAARGVMLPARLRLEHREVKRVVDGKVQTFKFAVPVLDLDVHPMQLSAGAPVQGEIPGGFTGELPGPSFTPVPSEAERALSPSVRDQVIAADDPAARESRQAALPATGLKPRTVDQVSEDACSVCGQPWTDGRPVRKGRDGESRWVHIEHGGDGRGVGSAADREAADITPAPDGAGQANVDTPPGTANNGPVRTPEQIGRRSTTVFRDAYDKAPKGKKANAVNRLRHALVYTVTGGRTCTSTDLDAGELSQVWARMDDIQTGRITYEADTVDDAAGVTWRSGSGRETTVMWSELEPAATAVPAEDGAT